MIGRLSITGDMFARLHAATAESNVISKLSGCRADCPELKDITSGRLSITVTQ